MVGNGVSDWVVKQEIRCFLISFWENVICVMSRPFNNAVDTAIANNPQSCASASSSDLSWFHS